MSARAAQVRDRTHKPRPDRAAVAVRVALATGLLAAASLLAACATAPAAPAGRDAAAAAAPAAFDASGRFSARNGSEAVAGQFSWVHAPPDDRLTFASPLGQALAQLHGSEAGIALTLADGRTMNAPDWETLTVRALGVPIPVTGLAWWIRGVPRPGAPHAEERDERGRPGVLRQDGWEIVYGYRDDDARAPARLRLAYPDVDVRLAIDAWR